MIIPGEKLRDDVIIGINSNQLGVTLKDWENALFSLKPKLTLAEIQAFLGDCMQTYNNNVSEYLKKSCKENIIRNPFDETLKCILYERKY